MKFGDERDRYHAENPMGVDIVHRGTRVRVPRWDKGGVVGWVDGTVFERREVKRPQTPAGVEITFLVRLDTGEQVVYWPYSIAHPTLDDRSHKGGIAAAESIAQAFGLKLSDLRAFASRDLEGSLPRDYEGDIGSSDVSIHLSSMGLYQSEALRVEAERLHDRNELVQRLADKHGMTFEETLDGLTRLFAPRED